MQNNLVRLWDFSIVIIYIVAYIYSGSVHLACIYIFIIQAGAGAFSLSFAPAASAGWLYYAPNGQPKSITLAE